MQGGPGVLRITSSTGKGLTRFQRGVVTAVIEEILNFILESEDDLSGMDDMKLLSAQPEDKIYTLDDMKAAVPFFFNRRAMRFHGTKKIYKYGNFIVLKNISKLHGGNGNIFHKENFPIYQFVHTEDSPEGRLRKVGEGIHLDDAKEMIKKKDFRDFAERAGPRQNIPESGEFPVSTRRLSKEECKALDHYTGEMDEFPIMRMETEGSIIDYEEGDHGIWILMVRTAEGFREQGRAKALLSRLAAYASEHGKSVYPGDYTDMGRDYLRPIVKKHWPNSEF